MLPRHPRSPLFPYTTLFRSMRMNDLCDQRRPRAGHAGHEHRPLGVRGARGCPGKVFAGIATSHVLDEARPGLSVVRSEEHTSELQSRRDLVCRLLLEKKKKN